MEFEIAEAKADLGKAISKTSFGTCSCSIQKPVLQRLLQNPALQQQNQQVCFKTAFAKTDAKKNNF